MSQSNEPVARGSGSAGVHNGKFFARVEHEVEEDFGKALEALRRRPSMGMLLVGAAAVIAAQAIGVGEVALGVALGYAAYRALRQERSSRATTTTEPAKHE
jgi:hypothetical protein